MYILKDENNKIVSYSKSKRVIEDAKTMFNLPNGKVETTNEEIYCSDNGFILESEWQQYIQSEEYKYNQEKENAMNEIEALKEDLSKDDYKIIKIMEAKLKGEEIPYGITELLTNRNAARTRINELRHIFS